MSKQELGDSISRPEHSHAHTCMPTHTTLAHTPSYTHTHTHTLKHHHGKLPPEPYGSRQFEGVKVKVQHETAINNRHGTAPC